MRKFFNIKIIVGIVLVVQSLALFYFFGTRWLNQDRINHLNTGAMVVRNAIVRQIVETGRVIVENEEGQRVILVPLVNQPEE